MEVSYKRLKAACYTTNITMSVVGNLSPVLFLTFRSLYGISYSMMGFLVLVNFVTQLGIDLIFSFFSHRFNIPAAVRFTPVLGTLGLVIYGVLPMLFPQYAWIGILIGTVIFSAASGFAEVLISPVIAAIPAKDPDREMSKLHSVYAWGVVGVIGVSTLFLVLFGGENWNYLALLFAMVPLTSAILFRKAVIPEMETPERISGVVRFLKDKKLWLCTLAIFLGGASEVTMAQWCSGYLERAMQIPKVWGDLFGTALFAVMLGLGRTLYGKYGKNLGTVLFAGAFGATVCYLVAALCPLPLAALLACAFTGFCVSVMWPGCLVVASDFIPHGGVFLFAMMAAGGDLGAAVGPQMIGIITDKVSASTAMSGLLEIFNLQPDQLGMKLGVLSAAVFPVLAIGVYYKILRLRKKEGL